MCHFLSKGLVCESDSHMHLHSSRAGPASSCLKILRSVIQENKDSGADRSAGVLLVQADTPIMVSFQILTELSMLVCLEKLCNSMLL